MVVFTNHKNLAGFMTTKKLNQQQVCWAETLALYNFTILYRKGMENSRADALSCRADYQEDKPVVSYTLFRQKGEYLVFNQPQLAATAVRITATGLIEELKKAYKRDSHV